MTKIELSVLALASIVGISIGWQWGNPDLHRRRKAIQDWNSTHRMANSA